jgi:hypothetical protein
MIFRFLILLLLISNIQSKSIDYTFTVDGSDLTFTDLSADYESQYYLRSSIWKLFVENDNDNKFQKCWNSFLTNKKIAYSISGTTLSIESINNNSVTYKYSFDLNKIKGLNLSKASFINYCDELEKNVVNEDETNNMNDVNEDDTDEVNVVNENSGYETSTDTFDPDDI